MPTAAGIIIGNEILTGKFADENGPYLVQRMRALGVDLLRLATVPDVRQTVAEEVRFCADRFDHVFTSGGVGPTHDDVTLESVASAFGVAVVPHPDLVSILEKANLTNQHAMRMAMVPEGTELLWEGSTTFPVIRCRNVIVLPGVPRLFQKKFESVQHLFSGTVVHTTRLYTAEWETAIAGRLAAAQDAYPGVDIGSYPRFDDVPRRVIVTLESRDVAALAEATAMLSETLSLIDPKAGESR